MKMVDITEKKQNIRTAVSKGKIYFSKEVYTAIKNNTLPKGNPLPVAQVAGILAAKNVPHIVPLTHPINITYCDVHLELKMSKNRYFIEVVTIVKTLGNTGPDIESLFATMVSLLTVYDMIKSIDSQATVEEIKLVSKTGGERKSK